MSKGSKHLTKDFNSNRQLRITELERDYQQNYSQGNYEQAVTSLKKLLFFIPESVEYMKSLGELYMEANDLSSAISCYEVCAEKDEEAKILYEQLLLCKGMLISGHTYSIDKAIVANEMEEKNVKSHYMKAISYLALNNKESALLELNKLLKIDPQNIEGLLLMSNVLLSLGKENKHIMWKAYSVNPQHPTVKIFTDCARVAMKECVDKANENILKGKLDISLLWCSKALTIFPNHPEPLILRSAINNKLKLLKECLRDLNLAIKSKEIDSK